MPRYYLHVCNANGDALDDEGQEFEDLEAARAKGIESIRAFLSEELRSGLIDLNGSLRIADEAGDIVSTVAFADAVEVRGDG
jgi:hypothetical protein